MKKMKNLIQMSKSGIMSHKNRSGNNYATSKKNNRTIKLVILLSMTLLGPWSGIPGAVSTTDSNNSIDKYIQEVMEEYQISTLTAAIIENNSTIWSNSYPDSNREENVYMIGSISKTFTATAILQLHEQGLIDLDANISTYLPFDLYNPNFPNEAITIRMLLSHTSSLNSDSYSTLFYALILAASNGLDSEIIQDYFSEVYIQHLESINESELIFPLWLKEYVVPTGSIYVPDVWSQTNKPGEIFKYANVGFDILGYLLEIISNQSITEYLSENIWLPLNMTQTGIDFRDFDEEYLAEPVLFYYTNYPHYNLFGGSGGIRSTLADLSQYLYMHMNGGSFNNQNILQFETAQLMHEPMVNETEEYQYGLGWATAPHLNTSGHSGYVMGFTSSMQYRKKNTSHPANRGVIILSNEGILSNPDYIDTIRSFLFEYNLSTIQGFPLIPSFLGIISVIFYLKRKIDLKS